MTVSPIIYLIVFCGVMAFTAIVRYVLMEERDSTALGVIIIVIGLTLVSVLWVGVDEEWFTSDPSILYLVGTIAGILILLGCWWLVTGSKSTRDGTGRKWLDGW